MDSGVSSSAIFVVVHFLLRVINYNEKKKPKDSITSSEDYIVYENKISAQVKLLFLQF